MSETDATAGGVESTGSLHALNPRERRVKAVLQVLAASLRALARHFETSNVEALIEKLAEAAEVARRDLADGSPRDATPRPSSDVAEATLVADTIDPDHGTVVDLNRLPRRHGADDPSAAVVLVGPNE
jgi:hypothetical protein